MKIGNYEFAIKNFKYLESRSEETCCFSAVLYVNGKKLANCGNDGHGGSTDIHVFPQNRQLDKQVEEFLQTQPKIKFENFNFEIELTLEYIVDELVAEYFKAQHFKKLMKEASKCLIFCKPNKNYYKVGWKKHTIAELIRTQQGLDILKNTIAVEIAKGNILMNENIPSELLHN